MDKMSLFPGSCGFLRPGNEAGWRVLGTGKKHVRHKISFELVSCPDQLSVGLRMRLGKGEK